MSTREQRRDRMEWAGLMISGASLAVGIAALCMNEKGEIQMKETSASELREAKRKKKEADRERKANGIARKAAKRSKQNQVRAYANSIDYHGPIIMLNTDNGRKRYGLVELKDTNESWVAMEINSVTGRDRQAIVCDSRDEAKSKAIRMKKAHRPGSRQSMECRQGYAKVDTSSTIDVGRWFAGKEGTLYRV